MSQDTHTHARTRMHRHTHTNSLTWCSCCHTQPRVQTHACAPMHKTQADLLTHAHSQSIKYSFSWNNNQHWWKEMRSFNWVPLSFCQRSMPGNMVLDAQELGRLHAASQQSQAEQKWHLLRGARDSFCHLHICSSREQSIPLIALSIVYLDANAYIT